ncbi:ubiquitin specific proteinase [Sarcoptes scabiei]|nr:ubiquitin specific proteinase [Sarcoptes scabiei]
MDGQQIAMMTTNKKSHQSHQFYSHNHHQYHLHQSQQSEMIATSFISDDLTYEANNHNSNDHHPELEHLAKTMPIPSGVADDENRLLYGDDGIATNTNDNDEIDSIHCRQQSTSSSLPVRCQSRMSISHDKGLLNMPGQNNCFLNSAVQVLWHLDVFRRSLREISGHACMGDCCLFCALKDLFNQFQSSSESALPPDSLRFALAQSFNDQRRFRLGYMDDAAECFENILNRIHYHLTNKELDSTTNCLPHCLPHQKFSMNLFEQIVCDQCGSKSDPFIFTQMIHYISTSALCAQANSLLVLKSNQQTRTDPNDTDERRSDKIIDFGPLLKIASSMGDVRNCPKLCGARMNIKRLLLNRPDIISLGLIWDTDHPSISFIRNVYKIIDVRIHLNEIFDLNKFDEQQQNKHRNCRLDKNSASAKQCFDSDDKHLDLVGLVTYYGKHYSTYIFNTKLSQWIYFDDATVRVVGPEWKQVVDKCIKGHFQPLLLLYANPLAKIINTEQAFKEIVPMTIIKRSNDRNENVILQRNDQKFSQPKRPLTITSTASTEKSSISSQHHHHQQQPTSKKSTMSLPTSSLASSIETNTQLASREFLTEHHYRPFVNEIPESPSATSTASYFSDVGDSTDGYISRKVVENIIKIHRNSKKLNHCESKTSALSKESDLNYRKNHRNSSSSLESFDSVARQPALFPSSRASRQDSINSTESSSLQRRDSGNSSGDRASSASSNETPFYSNIQNARRLLKSSSTTNATASTTGTISSKSSTNMNHKSRSKNSSDQGYDSFSLSSSDSFPSTNSTPLTSSPSKMNSKLKQIPEDVQLIDSMINDLQMDDCDKICSEVDVLLLKSYEKEREGDLRAAVALSDSAAAKARSAMDMPYSNHQILISVKMKHSMCVMRSASLHKRVLEIEAEEKRLMKASLDQTFHTRQSSRDSSHGRHSRQGSRDGTVAKESKSSKESYNSSNNKSSSSSLASPKNLEIYATLPKKSKHKKEFTIKEQSSGAVIKDDRTKSKLIETDPLQNTQSTKSSLRNKNYRSIKKQRDNHHRNHLTTDSEFSDYCSEWEAIQRRNSRKKTIEFLQRNNDCDELGNGCQRGWQSCRENDSEGYVEFNPIDDVSSRNEHRSKQSTNLIANASSERKQQCKIKRKLMFGSFLKAKNRSLPDLREEELKENDLSAVKKSSPIQTNGIESDRSNNVAVLNQRSLNPKTTCANINSKGFYQAHKSFVAEHGLLKSKNNPTTSNNNRPSLIKVQPPHLESFAKPIKKIPADSNPSIPSANDNDSMKSTANQSKIITAATKSPPPPPPPRKTISLNRIDPKSIGTGNQSPSLQLSSRMNVCNQNDQSARTLNVELETRNPTNPVSSISTKKPRPLEIANFINSSRILQNHSPMINDSKHNQSPIKLNGTNRFFPSEHHPLNDHHDQLRSPQNIHMPIPLNPLAQNDRSNQVYPHSQHFHHQFQRPPDYETTLKRLEMNNSLEMVKKSLHKPQQTYPQLLQQQQQSQPSISIANGKHSPIYSNLPNTFGSASKPIAFEQNHREPIALETSPPTAIPESERIQSVKSNISLKKSVKFSDQIELVASADDELDEPLPNLLFEKVLGKNFLINQLQSP